MLCGHSNMLTQVTIIINKLLTLLPLCSLMLSGIACSESFPNNHRLADKKQKVLAKKGDQIKAQLVLSNE